MVILVAQTINTGWSKAQRWKATSNAPYRAFSCDVSQRCTWSDLHMALGYRL